MCVHPYYHIWFWSPNPDTMILHVFARDHLVLEKQRQGDDGRAL